MRFLSIAAIACLMSISAPPAFAWGAIAIGQGGVIGHAYDYASEDEAAAAAMANCGSSSCTLRETFQASCVTSVFKQSGAQAEFEWVFGSDLQVLESSPARMCGIAKAEGWQRCVDGLQFCSN